MKVRPQIVHAGGPGWVDVVYRLFVWDDDGPTDELTDYDPVKAKALHEAAGDLLEALEAVFDQEEDLEQILRIQVESAIDLAYGRCCQYSDACAEGKLKGHCCHGCTHPESVERANTVPSPLEGA